MSRDSEISHRGLRQKKVDWFSREPSIPARQDRFNRGDNLNGARFVVQETASERLQSVESRTVHAVRQRKVPEAVGKDRRVRDGNPADWRSQIRSREHRKTDSGDLEMAGERAFVHIRCQAG